MRRRPPTKRQLCAPAPSDFVVRLRAMVIVRTMAHGDGSRAAAFLSVLSVFLAAMFLRTGAWRAVDALRSRCPRRPPGTREHPRQKN